ncbi:MAG TPA: L,D-transpeptidase family protein [Acidimicrobiales bacterium]
MAGELSSTGNSRQLVTVEGTGYTTQTATVTLWQRSGGCWSVAGGPWSGFIGYNGFSDHKREGDGMTPTGAYGFGPVVYGNAANPGVHEAYHPLVCGDWWDENASSGAYNTFQHVACGSTPSWASGSEALWTETRAYPSFAVVDYNAGPIVPGAGSAIFVHASTGGPTAGCVSVPLGDLDTFLRWMQPSESPLIVMGPVSEISRF